MKYFIMSICFVLPVLCMGQDTTKFSISQALELLPPHTTGYFATVDGDMPDLRGWQYQGYENGKFIFATANTKNVYKQMQKNSNVAFACAVGEYHFRINGRATVVQGDDKLRLFKKLSPAVQQMYKAWDNPVLVIFTVSGGELRIAKGFGAFQTIKY